MTLLVQLIRIDVAAEFRAMRKTRKKKLRHRTDPICSVVVLTTANAHN